ncbi:SAVED domain-containing protein [Herpetosiphon llansteffanensis]
MNQFEPIYHPESRPLSLWLAPNSAPARADLARECRVRGLVIERDPSQAASEIREQIAASQGVVLYLDSLNVTIDQPLGVAIQYLQEHPETPWWLVCDGLEIAEVREAANFQYLPFGQLQHSWQLDQHNPVQVAQALLKVVFQRFMRQNNPSWLSLLACTYNAAPAKGAHIALDWSDWTQNNAIDTAAWPIIQQAIIDVKNVIVGQAIERLLILPRVHLTAAFLIGAVFNTRLASINQCWVANEFRELQWWNCNDQGTAHGISAVRTELEQGSELSLEWAITQPVATVKVPIDRYIEQHLAGQLKQRLLYSRDGIDSSKRASAVAQLFRSELLANPSSLVHCFAALPAALAVCFGRQLNACPPLQCYELKGRSDYVPSWIIKA